MKRYKHNLSGYQLLTGNMGKLYPIGLVEAIPGDTFQHSTSALIRLSPLAAPVMHPISVRVHHFFVPHRLSWSAINDDCGKGWENFITGGKDGMDASNPPQVDTTGTPKDLLDYLGLPTVAGISVSALPVAAVNLIWNEFYRDEDLGTERLPDDLSIPAIAWEKDYFTASRPWPQKGPEITLPLTGNAPITGLGKAGGATSVPNQGATETGGGTVTYDHAYTGSQSPGLLMEAAAANGAPNVYADMSQVSAANINDVRRAFALQRFQEARSRYGSRYTEYLRYLGVRNPKDARLQRPEFLGGGRVKVAISEVLQTAPDSTTPRFGVGDLYGHGVAAVRSNAYRRFIEEHGYILSFISLRPKAIYTTGINRTWLRQDKEDFFQRELEFIGQQPVLNNEIYADAVSGGETFGYSDRYREYRENPSLVTAEFRTTLNYWHLAREFSAAPALNEAFVTEQPSKRIFNEQAQDSLWMMVQHRRVARRILSKSAYGKII